MIGQKKLLCLKLVAAAAVHLKVSQQLQGVENSQVANCSSFLSFLSGEIDAAGAFHVSMDGLG